MFDIEAEKLMIPLAEEPRTAGVWSGTSEDFSRLYQNHQKLVRAVIFQITGVEALDDLVQETFIKIWTGYSHFRHESKFSSWVYRISVNSALDYLRLQKVKIQVSSDTTDVENFSDQLEGQVTNRDLVSKGLMALSEEHRAVLVLSLIHDLPISEVSTVLEVPEGTVKSRLHYAKLEFRHFLSINGVDL